MTDGIAVGVTVTVPVGVTFGVVVQVGEGVGVIVVSAVRQSENSEVLPLTSVAVAVICAPAVNGLDSVIWKVAKPVPSVKTFNELR